ncbi:MAG: family 20 glycosylhydrolase, partial [Candidatus Aminicenantes bacterium]|nr:family 20 glycosylhydrolase [Candidatus Aminicenantes bacterium]
ANTGIRAIKKKNRIPDNHSLQAYFNRRIAAIITGHGKRMAGWEQILQPGLPGTTVIQSYLGEKSLVESARSGYQVVNSKANELYIDLLFPADFHYLYDPLPVDIPLNSKEKKLILGSEATMWGELVSHENIDSRIWPRTAAIAERLWSPAEIRDIPDLYRRLELISIQLEAHGLTHLKNQDMMLRRLVRGRDTAPLKCLVDVVEPIILYDRPQWQECYTQKLPQTRLVDAAVPDTRVAREFRNKIDSFLQDRDPATQGDLQKILLLWKHNHLKLKPVIDRSPILAEIETLSAILSRTAEIGLKALEILAADQRIDPAWIKDSIQQLEQAKLPRGDCRLRIVEALEKLLIALNK